MIAKKDHRITNLPDFSNNDHLVYSTIDQLSILENGFGDLEERHEKICLLATKRVKTARS